MIESRSQEEEEPGNEEDESEENNAVINGDISNGEPETLLVLAEEEIVAIDLKDENWKMMSLPYLVSLHASAVTCSQYVSGMACFIVYTIKQVMVVGNLYTVLT